MFIILVSVAKKFLLLLYRTVSSKTQYIMIDGSISSDYHVI